MRCFKTTIPHPPGVDAFLYSWVERVKKNDKWLACTVLLLTAVIVITVVKMLRIRETKPNESAANFDHCDEKYRC